MTRLQISDKVATLSKLIREFDDCLSAELCLAAGFAGLQELPPIGDKYLALLWGAADSLGQLIGADMTETSEAILLFLAKFPDRGDILARIMIASSNPLYKEWIKIAGGCVRVNVEFGNTSGKKAYGSLAQRYVADGGG